MMYQNTTLAATGGAAVIAGIEGLWWVLGAFALIAAGSALLRIVPRKEE